jgi:hypothetical protein
MVPSEPLLSPFAAQQPGGPESTPFSLEWPSVRVQAHMQGEGQGTRHWLSQGDLQVALGAGALLQARGRKARRRRAMSPWAPQPE